MEWIKDATYRKAINIPKDVTFGIEVEFCNADRLRVNDRLLELFNNNVLSQKWNVVDDRSLYDKKAGPTKDDDYSCGEAVSGIFTDDIKTWADIKTVCDEIIKLGGEATSRCGGHIHIGSNILEDNLEYYIRFAKLWTIYEGIILRFSAGLSEVPRHGIYKYAPSNVSVFKYINFFEDGKRNFEDFRNAYSTSKHLAVSLRNLDLTRPFHTIEVRCPNGTLEPFIWQNNINFFVKLLLACKDDSKDWKYIDRIFQYEKFSTESVLLDLFLAKELSDFIFSEDIDKDLFSKQYFKDGFTQSFKRTM